MPTPLSDLGEFGLIDRLHAALGPAATHPDLLQGIGDDAAVYRIDDDRALVVTTDALVEGVHVDRAVTPMERLGFKAVSVNVSDVCAMNARPTLVTVALGLPPAMPVEDVDALYAGIRRACERYGCALAGGDTSQSHALMLSVTAIGEARIEDVVYRRGARIGDLVCVTGDLGAAFAGLKTLLAARDRLREDPDFRPDFRDREYVVSRQLAPFARLDAVEAFARAGVRPSAMVDISDGLASEAHHIARHSGVGMRIYEAAIPLDPETREVASALEADAPVFALFGGEDYELLFTMAEADLERLPNEGLFRAIGRVVSAAEGVVVQTAEGEEIPLAAAGFAHFAPPPDAPADASGADAPGAPEAASGIPDAFDTPD